MPREDPYVRQLQERIKTLERDLLRRPQLGDVEHVRERIARKERMYEVVLARNEVLKRRLDEAHARIHQLERAEKQAA